MVAMVRAGTFDLAAREGRAPYLKPKVSENGKSRNIERNAIGAHVSRGFQ
jgi:hypothetical protein